MKKKLSEKERELDRIFKELGDDPEAFNPDGSLTEYSGYKDIADKLEKQIEKLTKELDKLS